MRAQVLSRLPVRKRLPSSSSGATASSGGGRGGGETQDTRYSVDSLIWTGTEFIPPVRYREVGKVGKIETEIETSRRELAMRTAGLDIWSYII